MGCGCFFLGLSDLAGGSALQPFALVVTAAFCVFILSFVLGAPLWAYLGTPPPSRASHGTAHWGTPRDAERSGMLVESGETKPS